MQDEGVLRWQVPILAAAMGRHHELGYPNRFAAAVRICGFASPAALKTHE